MYLNQSVIKEIIKKGDLPQNQFAYQIGIGRGSLSNALNGRRGVGRKTLAGLLRLFPEQTVASLTIEGRVAL